MSTVRLMSSFCLAMKLQESMAYSWSGSAKYWTEYFMEPSGAGVPTMNGAGSLTRSPLTQALFSAVTLTTETWVMHPVVARTHATRDTNMVSLFTAVYLVAVAL